MADPLYKLTGEFFKTLGHPARIRGPRALGGAGPVGGGIVARGGTRIVEPVPAAGVLRRAGVVVARKEGSTVIYSIASPDIAELLAVARKILTTVLSDRVAVLEDLRAGGPADVR